MLPVRPVSRGEGVGAFYNRYSVWIPAALSEGCFGEALFVARFDIRPRRQLLPWAISASTSLSRKPHDLVLPGSFNFFRIPDAASLSTVRRETANIRAASSRRMQRWRTTGAASDLSNSSSPLRSIATSRARLAGVIVGSAFNPARRSSIVVTSIVQFREEVT